MQGRDETTHVQLSGLIFLAVALFLLYGCESEDPGASDAASASRRDTQWRQAVTASRPSVAAARTESANRHIAVPVSINGGPTMAFLVDTGAPRTTMFIPGELLNVPAISQRFKSADQTMQGVGGAASAYRMRADSFAVGQTKVAPFEYIVMADRQDLLRGMTTPYGPVAGVLGNDYLSQYRVTIDYQEQKVWLENR
jgi:predicted aspartyl protease